MMFERIVVHAAIFGIVVLSGLSAGAVTINVNDGTNPSLPDNTQNVFDYNGFQVEFDGAVFAESPTFNSNFAIQNQGNPARVDLTFGSSNGFTQVLGDVAIETDATTGERFFIFGFNIAESGGGNSEE